MIRAEPSTAIGEQTSPEAAAETDPRQRLELLFRDLRSSADGLTDREAARRLIVYGRNELTRQGKRRWPAELVAQFVHPLALLLPAAAILAVISGSPVLGAAIAAVIALNAVFAFFQQQHAEHAVEALPAYLPHPGRSVAGRLPAGDRGSRIAALTDTIMPTPEVQIDHATPGITRAVPEQRNPPGARDMLSPLNSLRDQQSEYAA
jgi:Cation transporter/ATPase, N-terminus